MPITAQAITRLKAQLLTSNVRTKDFQLFQVVDQLIQAMGESLAATEALTGGSGGGGGTLTDASFITSDSETSTFPNSRQIYPGSGIQIHHTPSGRTVISSAIPFGMDGGGGEGEDGPPGPPGPAGATGAVGPQGSDAISQFYAFDGIDGEDGLPGIQGPQGFAGTTGATGAPGIPGIDGLDGEYGADGIPGVAGPAGVAGADGAPGTIGPMGPPGLDAEEPEYPYIIPGPQGPQGTSGGGGGSATTVEVDLGSLMWQGKFTITDAAISSSSKVHVWQAPGPYTGKGTRADEAQLQPVRIIAAFPGTGSAVVYWETPPIHAFKPTPIITSNQFPTTAYQSQKDLQGIHLYNLKRINKVRGNVKFSYSVYS